MSYYPGSYGSQYPPPPPPPLPPADTSKKWTKRDWLVKIYIPIGVPILVALIGAGVIFAPKSSTPSIPKLHASYNGAIIDLTLQQQGGFSIADLSENTDTGAFTAAAVAGGCADQIANGLVTSDNKVTFVLNQQANSGCAAATFDFTGQLDSAGSISGTWKNQFNQENGTFMLS